MTDSAPLLTVVSIGDQRISLYAGADRVATAPISSGKPGHATPTGIFSVLQKNRWHTSNIYSNAPMPFMQRLTWSGIALHEGALPGYPASHGCIRLSSEFAAELWGRTRLGSRVVVSPRDVRPQPFEHGALPVPVMTPLAPAASSQGPLALTATSVAPEPRRLNPVAYARLLQGVTASAVGLAQRQLQSEQEAAGFKIAAAQRAALTLDQARTAAREAGQLFVQARIAASQATVADRPAAQESALDAEAHLEEALRILATAEIEDREATPAAFDAVKRLRRAEETLAAAREAQSDAKRRAQPISVLISRKERRLFVRQGFQELFDVAVDIQVPDRPLGTHLMLAAAARGDGDVNWLTMTVPDQTGGSEGPARALDRIAIPAEALERIAERLWVGAAIIITDHGLGETSDNTDFVLLTR